MNEIIKKTATLYHEIDYCITNLVKSRLDKDKNKENEAIFKMESLLVNTMQHISWLAGVLKENSLIKWQTGLPKEMCTCLVTIVGGFIEVADWNGSEWDTWLEDSIIAWCKLSDIEPYKEDNNA